MRKNILYVVLLLFIVVLSSCSQEESPFTVPHAKVNFKIDLNGMDSDLLPFTYKIFTRARSANEYVGYGGLLVFMSIDGILFAYDLCCPYEDDKNVLIQPVPGGKAVCKKCQSTYITMYGLGTREMGPSQESLQRYSILPNSSQSGVFFITN